VDRPEIASHRSHIMDKRGEGVPIILSRSETLSGKGRLIAWSRSRNPFWPSMRRART